MAEAEGEENVVNLTGGQHLPHPVQDGPGGVPGEDHEGLQPTGCHQAQHWRAALIEDRQAQILSPAQLLVSVVISHLTPHT